MASSDDRHVWRLTRPRYAPGLDGEGARLAGGRWNSPGNALVYTASHLSLAVLESFVHLPGVQRTAQALPEMRAIRIALPALSIETVEARFEPADLERSRSYGDTWLAEQRSLALEVPAVVVPLERNVLINPRHPEIATVRVISLEPFRFDPRLAGDR